MVTPKRIAPTIPGRKSSLRPMPLPRPAPALGRGQRRARADALAEARARAEADARAQAEPADARARRGPSGGRQSCSRRGCGAGCDRGSAADADHVVRDGLVHLLVCRSGGARRGRHPGPCDQCRLAHRCPGPAGLPRCQQSDPGFWASCPVVPCDRDMPGAWAGTVPGDRTAGSAAAEMSRDLGLVASGYPPASRGGLELHHDVPAAEVMPAGKRAEDPASTVILAARS